MNAFIRNGFGMPMFGPSVSSCGSGLVGEEGRNSMLTEVPRRVLKNVESWEAGDSWDAIYMSMRYNSSLLIW